MSPLRRCLNWVSDELNCMALIIIAVVGWFSMTDPESWSRPLSATFYCFALFASVLMIGRWSWARWVCTALFAGGAAFALALLFLRGFNWLRVAAVIGLAYNAWSVYRDWMTTSDDEPSSTDSDDSDRPMVSLVALLRERGWLDPDAIARGATRAWGIPFAGSDAPGDVTSNFVVGESPLFIVQAETRTFIVHHHDSGYFNDPEEVAKEVWEARRKAAVLEHEAWMSVDLLRSDNEKELTSPTPAVYALIGKLLAELIDDRCLGILCPAAGKFFIYDEETEGKLRGGDPLVSLSEGGLAPVIHIDGEDPRMKAAVAEARERWPEFEQAFSEREDDRPFSIKFPLGEGDEKEFIWATVSAIENDVIYGELGNEPMHSAKKIGDRIQARVSELNDWVYIDRKGEIQGGFTVKVLSEEAKARESDDED